MSDKIERWEEVPVWMEVSSGAVTSARFENLS